MKERTWLGTLLSFASPCRGKMAASVALAILSVAGGFVHPAVFGAAGKLGGDLVLVRRLPGWLCR